MNSRLYWTQNLLTYLSLITTVSFKEVRDRKKLNMSWKVDNTKRRDIISNIPYSINIRIHTFSITQRERTVVRD